MKRQLAILGSTGSIGTQALEVVSEHADLFEVYVLTANEQAELLIEQAYRYRPEAVVIANERKYPEVKRALSGLPIKVWAGTEAIAQVVRSEPIDMVLTALVGYAGLQPTIAAIQAGKAIALANKETLVVAGELVIALAKENRVPILPVDSEHSAIYQCLNGERNNPVEKIILTASGGPFRTKTPEELARVTKAQALRHPNWSMGAKVTIDSASMMNKGFEMIEAKWLFGLEPEQIQVLVHPQSVIHSMVQFADGAVMAQLGVPDMKLPIAYALSWPQRLKSTSERLDFNRYATLTFEEPDMRRFRNLAFAFEAAHRGGNMPCILNAANEVAVEAFLQEQIAFLQMSEVIERTLAKASFLAKPTYEDYVQTDGEARRIAKETVAKSSWNNRLTVY
ncbi:MAG: 1-deoxy-D-xylulose-5-phosphate reductoisomerase [Tannerella sp.]|jgi:1-deoxy-D-xylulose-5-phosphate reductoisomerase|nr:1-deoxy-D-xylulose-5-phosphate reductoisomerase [Tannerella sp.]